MWKNHLTTLPDSIGCLTNLTALSLQRNKLKKITSSIKNIINVELGTDSYDIDNLSNDCNYLQIDKLDIPLTNLPTTMEEIRLYNPKMVDIKLPFGCKLYINDILQ